MKSSGSAEQLVILSRLPGSERRENLVNGRGRDYGFSTPNPSYYSENHLYVRDLCVTIAFTKEGVPRKKRGQLGGTRKLSRDPQRRGEQRQRCSDPIPER